VKAAALVLLCALAARAEDVRVEPRQFVKQGRFFTSLGATWLERGDYWLNPGLLFSATYYPTERGGPEARLFLFFSSLSDSAQRISTTTGFVPDARRPDALALLGWRHSLTYGKLAIAGTAFHFDVQGAAHAGGLFTDAGIAPAFGASAGIVGRLGSHIFTQFDLGLLLSFEQRQRSSAALGFLPVFSVGVDL
jgi:hypothetical protein